MTYPIVPQDLVAEAARAPSAHNTQPARWLFRDGKVHLLADEQRRLPVADPAGADHAVGLGAAWEGMSIALSARHQQLAPPQFDAAPPEEPLSFTMVASAPYTPGAQPDPLAAWVRRRTSFRGKFRACTTEQRQNISARLKSLPGVAVLAEPQRIADLARWHDQATIGSLREPGYYRELYNWLRFSRRHPDYARDGLNADALQLGWAERAFGGWFMHPRAFQAWRRIGLAGLLMSERAQIESSAALVAVVAPQELSRFDCGRHFYRTWLAVAALGLAACPMSALSDAPAVAGRVREHLQLDPTLQLINVLRVGLADSDALEPACRLPVAELLCIKDA